MNKGKSAKKSLRLLALQIFLFLFFSGISGYSSIMERPRVIHDLRTKYFDILYSKESTYTAQILAENADTLFEKAFESLGAKRPFIIPVVISPDSDVFSIKYTFYPYNRITIYEGVFSAEDAGYKDVFLERFYHELVKAVAGSIRTPFDQFVSAILGNSYQPLSLINLPFSFVEGIAFTEDKKMDFGIMDDGYFLQVLSQAKYENKFPTWLQASSYNDQRPENDLALAAGCAFAAFLQQTYGFEKYYEFWQYCTKFRPGRLTRSNFKKIYNRKLEDVWKEFEAAVPLPENLLPASEITTVSKNKTSTYRYLSYTNYGIVFFDRIKNEVRIIKNGKEYHLFYASDIDNIQASPDGEKLLVSFEEYRSRKNFKAKICKVYDLKTKKFHPKNLNLKTPGFFELSDGSLGIAGINISEKKPVLQIYSENRTLIYEQEFDTFSIPVGIACLEKGKLVYVYHYEQNYYFSLISLDEKNEFKSGEKYFIDGNIKGIQNISAPYNSNAEKKELVFQYVKPEENSFTRLGYLIIDSHPETSRVYVQKNDIDGGIYYPVLNDDGLYFSSKKMEYDELKFMNLSSLEFDEIPLGFVRAVSEAPVTVEAPSVAQLKSEYDHHFYVPFKYTVLGALYPFLPVQSFSFTKDVELWPGLGFTFSTVADPFENTSFIISSGFGFLPAGISDRESFDKAIDDMRSDIKNHQNDYSLALMIKNTSTPFDLKYGLLWIFNNDGDYKLSQTGMISWTHPVILNVNLITLSAQFIYSMSNVYYDKNQKDSHPDLEKWVNPSDSYKLLEWAFGAEFKNTHQAGKTKFEQLGIDFGTLLYTTFDLLPDERLRNVSETVKKSRETYYNISLNTSLDVPFILPFRNPGNTVLNWPLKLYFQTFYEKEIACKAGGEFLLIGTEPHAGLSPVYFNLSRIGLYLGYYHSLEYSTANVALPDIKHLKSYKKVYDQSERFNNFYMSVRFDFVEAVGLLSQHQVESEFKISYVPEKKDFRFSLLFNLEM